MPQGMTVSFQGFDSGQQFCSYHYGTTTQSNANLVYAVLPDVFTNGTGCGTQSAAADNETGGLSRELVDVITDPINNTGWGDFNFNDCPFCGDLGDMCASQATATNTLNGHPYNVSEIWSQREDLCVASSNYLAPTASFTAHVKLTSVAFSGTASARNNGASIASYSWSFGDGKKGAGAHVTHTYAAKRTYTVVLTVTDSLGFVKRVRHTVTTT